MWMRLTADANRNRRGVAPGLAGRRDNEGRALNPGRDGLLPSLILHAVGIPECAWSPDARPMLSFDSNGCNLRDHAPILTREHLVSGSSDFNSWTAERPVTRPSNGLVRSLALPEEL